MDSQRHCWEINQCWGFLSGLESELLEQAGYYWHIRLPRKDGSSELSDGYEFMKRGEDVPCIEHPPKVPDVFDELWQWFLDLNNSRQADNKLSFSDMKAYFDLTQSCPSRWDLSLIQMLDSQFLQMQRDNNKD